MKRGGVSNEPLKLLLWFHKKKGSSESCFTIKVDIISFL